jgi:hypothetical protein
LRKLYLILHNLIYITYLAELLPLILFLIFFNKIKSTEIRVFFVYTIVFALFLSISIYTRFFLKNLNLQLIVNRISLVVEFIFLSIFFYYSLSNKYRKWIFIIWSIIFFSYSIYDYNISKSGYFSFIPLVIECLFFLVVIVNFFYEKIQYSISAPIYNSPVFWISVAFLIYFSGNFFLFLLSNSMFKNQNFKDLYTLIYSSVTIFKNIFLCVAVITNRELVNQQQMEAKPIDIDLGTFNPIKKNL